MRTPSGVIIVSWAVGVNMRSELSGARTSVELRIAHFAHDKGLIWHSARSEESVYLAVSSWRVGDVWFDCFAIDSFPPDVILRCAQNDKDGGYA